MNGGAVMKQEILSISASIALFVVLVWLYTMPFQSEAVVTSQIDAEHTEQSDDAAGDDRQALKRGFHSLFNALFDR
jgi:hypothetical protein